LALALGMILKDSSRRENLVRLGLERASHFRWERTARLMLKCYEDLAGSTASTRTANASGSCM
jgi:hypothetical protein